MCFMTHSPEGGSALLTDLYQITMLQAYFDEGLHARASFEMFSRKLPAGRNFLLVAGLEPLLQWLEALRFTPEEVAWLADSGRFDVLILDELTYCLTFGWLDTAMVVDAIRSRPRGTHVIVTGRDAPQALIDAADIATEMAVIKHPYREQGIGAQPGIEL